MAFPDYISDTIENNTLYVCTSQEEIQRILSTEGEKWHTDDINELDQNFDDENVSDVSRTYFITEVIQRVTSRIMEFLAPRYRVDYIYRIPRIRQMATYMACYEITKRRGNEPLYESEYIEAIDTLEQYRDGTLYLDAPTSYPRAYLISGVVDNRYSQSPYRILPYSTTKVVSSERIFVYWGFNWL